MPAIQNQINLYVNANGQIVPGSSPTNALYRNNLNRNVFFIITPLSQAAVVKLLWKNTSLSKQGYTQVALATGGLGKDVTSEEVSYYSLVKDWNVFKCIPSSSILTKFPATVSGSISLTVSISEPDLSDSTVYTWVKDITTNEVGVISSLTDNQYVRAIGNNIETNFGILNKADKLVKLENGLVIIRALWTRSTTEPMLYVGNPSLEDNDFEDAEVGDVGLLGGIIAQQNENTIDISRLQTQVSDITLEVNGNTIKLENMLPQYGSIDLAYQDIDNIKNGSYLLVDSLENNAFAIYYKRDDDLVVVDNAFLRLKTINGETLYGTGDLELATKEDLENKRTFVEYFGSLSMQDVHDMIIADIEADRINDNTLCKIRNLINPNTNVQEYFELNMLSVNIYNDYSIIEGTTNSVGKVSSWFSSTQNGGTYTLQDITTSVVDNLTSTATDKALSANMGKELKSDIDANSQGIINNSTAIGKTNEDLATLRSDTEEDIADLEESVEAISNEQAEHDAEITNLQTNKQDKKPDGVISLLNANNKINDKYLPNFASGGAIYGGLFNATTGVATLTSNAKTKLGVTENEIRLTNNDSPITGFAANQDISYRVSVAGNFAGLDLSVNDNLVSYITSWGKIDNTDSVVSVNKKTGIVEININDIPNLQAILDTLLKDFTLSISGTTLTLKGTLNDGTEITDTLDIVDNNKADKEITEIQAKQSRDNIEIFNWLSNYGKVQNVGFTTENSIGDYENRFIYESDYLLLDDNSSGARNDIDYLLSAKQVSKAKENGFVISGTAKLDTDAGSYGFFTGMIFGTSRYGITFMKSTDGGYPDRLRVVGGGYMSNLIGLNQNYNEWFNYRLVKDTGDDAKLYINDIFIAVISADNGPYILEAFTLSSGSENGGNRKSYHKAFGVEIVSDEKVELLNKIDNKQNTLTQEQIDNIAAVGSKQDKLPDGTNTLIDNTTGKVNEIYLPQAQGGGLIVVEKLPTPTSTIFDTKQLYLQTSDNTLYYCILEDSEYKWSSTKGLDIFDSDIEFWNFGVSGLTSSNPQLTRTNDAVGKGWEYVGTVYGSAIKTDFDKVFNWQRIVDSSGNVFIRIPKYYRNATDNTRNIANYKVDDSYYVYSCFQNEKNGEEKDYIDIGAYKGSVVGNRLTSRSGVSYTGSKTIGEFRSYARANVEGGYTYQQQDIHVLMLLWDLFQIVFATRKTEDVLGTQWKEYDGRINCGDTDALVDNSLAYPMSICGKKSGTGGFKFFGIEDIVGYALEFIDGIYFSSSSIYVGYTPSLYTDNTTNKELLSYTRPTSSNYTIKLGIDPDNPCINYPSEVGGTENTYYTDYCWYDRSGTILYQGAYSFGASDGLFYGSGYYSASRDYVSIGARLCRRLL